MAETGSDDRDWWASPATARVWSSIAARLERGGLAAQGALMVDGLDREERRAVSALLGRDVLRDRVRIELAELDHRLRMRARLGVVEAAETVLARALVDRPARTEERAERRAAPHRAARADWEADPFLPWPVVAAWLDGMQRDGVLGRDPNPETLVTDALGVVRHRAQHLRARPETPEPVARTELAARLFGDAHALDAGRRLSAAVLRLVAAYEAEGDATASDAGRTDAEPRTGRQQWERIGILADRVSSTCLTAGLPGVGGPDRLVHLTWRDLDSGLRFAGGGIVLVCENPRVLEAAIEIGVPGLGLVCASGRPALVVLEVLRRLRDAGAHLLYHGDFDWAGVAMANDLVSRLGVHPWRMSAEEYLSAPAGPPLAGLRVHALWDAELTAAMAHRGLAVHEEALLPGLFTEFVCVRSSDPGPRSRR